MKMNSQLSDAELQELETFLCSDAAPETAMDVSTLEGFLTAIVIGPEVVMPSAWLRWVWDFEGGEEEVEFDSAKQAERVMNSVMGVMNHIAGTFAEAPESFEPVFWRSAEWGAAEWCEGFLLATEQFDPDSWASLWTLDAVKDMKQERTGLITPFLRLGDEIGMEITAKEGSGQKWMEAVQPALLDIHAFWQERRKPALEQMADFGASLAGRTIRRDAPKTGRNDSCPCGSGKNTRSAAAQTRLYIDGEDPVLLFEQCGENREVVHDAYYQQLLKETDT